MPRKLGLEVVARILAAVVVAECQTAGDVPGALQQTHAPQWPRPSFHLLAIPICKSVSGGSVGRGTGRE